MSTPTSTAPEDANKVRRAVAAAVNSPPVNADPALAALGAAEVGAPLLASNEGGTPAFWLVPLLQGDRACGYARVDLAGRVVQVSSFGAGLRDTAAWPPAAYFGAPPQPLVDEVRARHPGAPLSAATFSFDTSPARWAWRIAVGAPANRIAYVSPTGWYDKPAGRDAGPGVSGDREG